MSNNNKNISDQQISMLSPTDAAMEAGLFEQVEGGFVPQQPPVVPAETVDKDPSDRELRLKSLLAATDMLSRYNSTGGLVKSLGIPGQSESLAKRYDGPNKAKKAVETATGFNPLRLQIAKEKFEYASGHDKRLRRMSLAAAQAVTDRAFGNFTNKYYPKSEPEQSEKDRRALRKKVRHLIDTEQ